METVGRTRASGGAVLEEAHEALLTQLEPFEVTTPPEDVKIYGYRGKHLEWTVPGRTIPPGHLPRTSPSSEMSSTRSGSFPSNFAGSVLSLDVPPLSGVHTG